jgi:hypothetical protein
MADAPAHPQFSTEPQALTVDYAPRRVVMYHVTGIEIDAFAAGGNSVNLNLTFFGISVGALISFGSVLLSTTVTNPKTFATYVALGIASLVGTLVFGINGRNAYKIQKQRITDMKTCAEPR